MTKRTKTTKAPVEAVEGAGVREATAVAGESEETAGTAGPAEHTAPEAPQAIGAQAQSSCADETPKADARRPTKLEGVLELLRRQQGATIEQMQAATGWQAHSVRGALAGAIKKRLGLAVTSTKADGVRTYRIASTDQGAEG